jgi:hypothetical protein
VGEVVVEEGVGEREQKANKKGTEREQKGNRKGTEREQKENRKRTEREQKENRKRTEREQKENRKRIENTLVGGGVLEEGAGGWRRETLGLKAAFVERFGGGVSGLVFLLLLGASS